MLQRGKHPFLRDLVEHQAADLLPVARAKLFGQVPANRLAFAVRVGRDEDFVGFLRGILQFLQDFLPARDHFVGRLEILLDVHAQLALGQITDVTHRRHHLVIAPEIFVDGLRLCGRFDHDECLCHRETFPDLITVAGRCG